MKAAAAGERYNAGMQMVGQGVSAIGSLAGAGAFKGGKGGNLNTNYNKADLLQYNDIKGKMTYGSDMG